MDENQMDSDGEEEICELVDVLDMFIDSDFGDNDDFAGFVSDGDDEVLEADSDDDTGRYVSSFTSEKKGKYIFPDGWDNKKWKKECVIPKDNITFKEETGFNFVIPAEASELYFGGKIITDKLIKD